MSRAARRPVRLTPALVLVLIAGMGAVGLERSGRLPEPLADVVRDAETSILAPILAELGVEPDPAPPPPAVRAEASDREAVVDALAMLDQVAVRPERRAGYDRGDWPHWIDADGDCVNARHEVLASESLMEVELTADKCAAFAGLWIDPFTGESFTEASALDVDHMVPLAEAHRSGGDAWDREKRAAFANDLADPRGLIAVSAGANRSKSDQGPEDWLPPEEGYRCRYVADWVAVKARWELSMDERERVTAENVLRACAG